jgi:hypothetical protein
MPAENRATRLMNCMSVLCLLPVDGKPFLTIRNPRQPESVSCLALTKKIDPDGAGSQRD